MRLRFYSWSTGTSNWNQSYHAKVTVQIGNGSQNTLNQTLSNSGSSSLVVKLNNPLTIGSGANAITIQNLSKERISTAINQNHFVQESVSTNTITLNKRKVQFKHENDPNGYTEITANTDDIYFPSNQHGNMYSAFADVTSYVNQYGLGEYTVANMALREGNGGGTGYLWRMVYGSDLFQSCYEI